MIEWNSELRRQWLSALTYNAALSAHYCYYKTIVANCIPHVLREMCTVKIQVKNLRKTILWYSCISANCSWFIYLKSEMAVRKWDATSDWTMSTNRVKERRQCSFSIGQLEKTWLLYQHYTWPEAAKVYQPPSDTECRVRKIVGSTSYFSFMTTRRGKRERESPWAPNFYVSHALKLDDTHAQTDRKNKNVKNSQISLFSQPIKSQK